MDSLLLAGGPQAAAKAVEYKSEEFDLNYSMNSNEDVGLAEAIFGEGSHNLVKETLHDVPQESLMPERPNGKSVQMSGHEAEQPADPAHAMDSDANEHSNTAVEK